MSAISLRLGGEAMRTRRCWTVRGRELLIEVGGNINQAEDTLPADLEGWDWITPST